MIESPMGAPAGIAGAGAKQGRGGRGEPWRDLERPDARAVEVVVLFDGAIVEAHHFDEPMRGVLKPATRARLVGGGGALALALLLLGAAYLRGGGAWLDGLALALVLGGGWALVGGLLRRHDELGPRDLALTSGEALGAGSRPLADRWTARLLAGWPGARRGRAALLPVSGMALPAEPFPLLRSTGTGYELLWAEGLDGELITGAGAAAGGRQRRRSLGEAAALAPESDVIAGARALPLCEGTRARVDLGALTVHLKSVPAPRRQAVPLLVDLGALRYTGGAALAAALFLALTFAVPPDAKALSLGDAAFRARWVSWTVLPREEPESRPDWLKKKSDDRGGGAPSRSAKGPPGKRGRANAPDTRRRMAIAGDAKGPPRLARADLDKLVRSTAILGAISASNPALTSIFSRDRAALGSDATDALGHLVGTEIGDASGNDGLALVGPGRGGAGGDPEATIGLGPHGLATLGRGGPGRCSGERCDGYGLGPTGSLRAHKVRAVEPVDRAVVTTPGGLDRELVRRVVKRHLNEVKFCYEAELQAHPDLHGRVVVRFAIGGLGQVTTSAVQESTLGSPVVAQCVSQAVRRWEFPRAERGGTTIVSYPFTFVTPAL